MYWGYSFLDCIYLSIDIILEFNKSSNQASQLTNYKLQNLLSNRSC